MGFEPTASILPFPQAFPCRWVVGAVGRLEEEDYALGRSSTAAEPQKKKTFFTNTINSRRGDQCVCFALLLLLLFLRLRYVMYVNMQDGETRRRGEGK